MTCCTQRERTAPLAVAPGGRRAFISADGALTSQAPWLHLPERPGSVPVALLRVMWQICGRRHDVARANPHGRTPRTLTSHGLTERWTLANRDREVGHPPCSPSSSHHSS